MRARAAALALTTITASLAATLVGAPGASATTPGADGLVAFVRGGDVYTVTAAGTGLRRLTRSGGVSTPKWSPDGTTLAYEKAGWVWTMNADGSAKTRRFPGRAASWSPTGAALAYVGTWTVTYSDGGGSTTCAYDAVLERDLNNAAAAPRVLDGSNSGSACSWGVYHHSYGPTTSWVPDGSAVVFSYRIDDTAGSGEPTLTQIAQVAVADDAEQVLASWDGAHTVPQIDTAPRRDNVAYATDAAPDGQDHVFVDNRSGTWHRQVSVSPDAYASFPVQSPDNRYVLYTQRVPGAAPAVRQVTLGSTAAPRTLVRNAEQPDWQPLPQ